MPKVPFKDAIDKSDVKNWKSSFTIRSPGTTYPSYEDVKSKNGSGNFDKFLEGDYCETYTNAHDEKIEICAEDPFLVQVRNSNESDTSKILDNVARPNPPFDGTEIHYVIAEIMSHIPENTTNIKAKISHGKLIEISCILKNNNKKKQIENIKVIFKPIQKQGFNRSTKD